MKIRQAEILLLRLPFRFQVRHAAASRRENVTGFVVLTDTEGTIGCGEFLCRSYVMGEDVADCVERGRLILTSQLKVEILDAPDRRILQFHDQSTRPTRLARGALRNRPGFDRSLVPETSDADGKLVGRGCGHHAPQVEFSGVYPIVSGWKLTAAESRAPSDGSDEPSRSKELAILAKTFRSSHPYVADSRLVLIYGWISTAASRRTTRKTT